MKLTIVIVNYNVQYFLEQCLLSVQNAIKGHAVEVYVVDNNSVDGSVEMVREKFPWVLLIANKDNTGFSKANNQAMRVAKGKYVLLLNPDTVIEEDTLDKCIQFMDAHPEAGGLGVKMVDGKGKFLPESKRGLPTPETSFYKIFGVSRIFPNSKKFNRYYLGHLDNDSTHEIEILSGAFMWMRKSALDKVGLLDEAFFMYGEDIDLSWRIIQGGFKNYYFPDTTIIHYKGESTKKGSLNYVFVFYNAMVIFAKKHFSESNAKLFSFFIQIAIWLRASVAVLYRFIKALMLPLLDFAALIGLLFTTKYFYTHLLQKEIESSLFWPASISFSLIWIFSSWIGSGYDKPLHPFRPFKAAATGSFFILVAYSLLPETLRFSRIIVLASSILAPFIIALTRVISQVITKGKVAWKKDISRRFAVVGSIDEIERVTGIIQQSFIGVEEIYAVNPETDKDNKFQGDLSQLQEIVRVQKIDSVIFCAKDLSSSAIISSMSALGSTNIEFKIAPPETLYIIGSNSIDTSGDVYMMDLNSINKPSNKRLKATFDTAFSLFILCTLPIFFIVQKKPIRFISNWIQVIFRKKSWVGFEKPNNHSVSSNLPKIKSGILSSVSHLGANLHTDDNIAKMNMLYAKDYKVSTDVGIVIRNLRNLGR
ncbi:MAG: glycosyltransferase [Flavobacteriales bacterium]